MGNKEESQRHLKIGNDFYAQGDYIKACEAYRKCIELDPLNALAFRNLGLALAGQRKYDEAIAQYREALRVQPDYADAYIDWGNALYGQKKYDEAIAQYRETLRVQPNYGLAYRNWGLALAGQKKYDEAIAQYKEALRVQPDYADAYLNWGNALGNQNRYEDAIEQYQKAVQADPDYTYAAYALHNIAHYCGRQGKYQAARETWVSACQAYEKTKQKTKDANDADFFQYYGGVLHDVFGELDKAESIYKEGLTLNPDHPGILIGLINLYLERKDEDADQRTTAHWQARENYRKAERLLSEQNKKQEEASTFLQLGELLLKMEEYDEAEKCFLDALKKDPESATAYAGLGVIYTRPAKEDFKKAAQYFENALRSDPDDLTVWSNLAEVCLKLNLQEKAETEYKKILRITTGHVDTQIGLGEVYKAMGEKDGDQYEQAITHYTKGIKLAEPLTGSKRLKKKELAAVYYSRGYARVKSYEYSKPVGDDTLLNDALEDFKKCFDLDPDHHKSGRAKEKLAKRLKKFTRHWLTEKIGPWLILIPSIFVLALSQASFWYKEPLYLVDAGSYLTMTFGSLVFLVIGLYLPQIMKLKVAGIEIEKSSVDQITTSGSLGISK